MNTAVRKNNAVRRILAGVFNWLTEGRVPKHTSPSEPGLLTLEPDYLHPTRWLEVRAEPHEPGVLHVARHPEAHEHTRILIVDDLDVD